MEEVANVDLKVFYKATNDGEWIEHESITVEEKSIDKVKAAFSKALKSRLTWKDMQWDQQVGLTLETVGGALFIIGVPLTYAACARWGQSKWLATAPALTGCVVAFSGMMVDGYTKVTARSFLEGKEGGKCFEETDKQPVRGLYFNCSLKKTEHVAARVESADWKFTIPVWVLYEGK